MTLSLNALLLLLPPLSCCLWPWSCTNPHLSREGHSCHGLMCGGLYFEPRRRMRRMGSEFRLKEKNRRWRDSTCLGRTTGKREKSWITRSKWQSSGEKLSSSFFLALKSIRNKQKWQSVFQTLLLSYLNVRGAALRPWQGSNSSDGYFTTTGS